MRCILLVLCALALPHALPAQKSEMDLSARLLAKQLYLRGRWGSDKLSFDDSGRVSGSPSVVSFTLAGVKINKLKLQSNALVLEGQRFGVAFQKDVPMLVALALPDVPGSSHPEKPTLKIQRPGDGDFTAALDAIFTQNLADLPKQQPEWETFARKHFAETQKSPTAAETPVSTGPPTPLTADKSARPGPPASWPKVVKSAEPEFNDQARALRYSGIVLLNLIVDVEGKPSRIRILHPIGVGLDERAVAAVSRYVFKPAMQGGQPVPVELNIEVNYQIF
jgi:TonB family protein